MSDGSDVKEKRQVKLVSAGIRTDL
jgi:hypothetical protein